jgi:hypothetical protein
MSGAKDVDTYIDGAPCQFSKFFPQAFAKCLTHP